ncbi:MAG: hypothetical protein ACT4QD_14890 [Acidobacteriota bacterium]
MARTRTARSDPAFYLYAVLTLGMTWPLVAGLGRDVPGDLGDSLLNMWILGWGAEHAPQLLTGQLSWRAYWDANIFHPEPLALGFSEHLFGQVLQILPVYALTDNLILSYNLLFLSSFVLSGLGMYWLARDVLSEGPGFSRAAFLAGLAYAFLPLRIAQVAHIQSLSSQWMPFALLGFRRFIVGRPVGPEGRRTASPWSLVAGAVALLLQNWSCGYYLVYFTPFAVLFVLHQIVVSGRGRDWRLWGWLTVTAGFVAGLTWPFLFQYRQTQLVHGFDRSIGEVSRYSADVYSYVTAPEALRVWGGVLQTFPKPEGALFTGVVAMLLVLAALVTAIPRWSWSIGWRDRIGVALVSLMLVQLIAFGALLATGGFVTSFAGVPIRATSGGRLLAGVVGLLGVLLVVSPGSRQAGRRMLRSPLVVTLALGALAVWLSLGPAPRSFGRPLSGLGLYEPLYELIPGVAGLRVPARMAMVAAVFFSIVAAFGAKAVLARVRRPSLATTLISLAFLADVAFAPMPVNLTWGETASRAPTRVEPAATAPAVYRAVASMPQAIVIAEFPFGDPAGELRAVYYSTVHWKRLVNGYSGGFPQGYQRRVALFQHLAEDGASAWQALREADTTHVIVHEAAYPAGEAETVTRWLTSHGAVPVGRFDHDVLYALP